MKFSFRLAVWSSVNESKPISSNTEQQLETACLLNFNFNCYLFPSKRKILSSIRHNWYNLILILHDTINTCYLNQITYMLFKSNFTRWFSKSEIATVTLYSFRQILFRSTIFSQKYRHERQPCVSIISSLNEFAGDKKNLVYQFTSLTRNHCPTPSSSRLDQPKKKNFQAMKFQSSVVSLSEYFPQRLLLSSKIPLIAENELINPS